MSASQRSRRSSSAGTGEPGWAAMPIGLALTRPALPATAAARSAPATSSTWVCCPRSVAARAAARSASGSTTSRRRTPRSASAWATAVPAPPAPMRTTRSRSASGSPSRKERRKPLTSVLWPRVRPSRISTVLSAPIASTTAVDLVDQRHHRLLDRVRDVQAVEAELDAPASSRSRRTRSTVDVGLVDDLVDVAQPLAGGLALVQLRRQRRTDAVADQAGQPGPLSDACPGRHRPSLSGR